MLQVVGRGLPVLPTMAEVGGADGLQPDSAHFEEQEDRPVAREEMQHDLRERGDISQIRRRGLTANHARITQNYAESRGIALNHRELA